MNHRALCLGIVLIGFLACSPDDAPTSKSPAPTPNDPSVLLSEPQYTGEVWLNQQGGPPYSGCSMPLIDATRNLKCGSPPAIWEVAWIFIDHRDGKDRYYFRGQVPAGDPNPDQSSAIVEYAGERVVVFEDERQQIAIAPVREEKMYYPTSLTVQNLQFGPGSQCRGTRIGREGTLTCGYPGETTEVSWKFLGHANNKDTYTIARKSPADEEGLSDRKEIEYDGQRQVIFEDDVQRVVMAPADVPDVTPRFRAELVEPATVTTRGDYRHHVYRLSTDDAFNMPPRGVYEGVEIIGNTVILHPVSGQRGLAQEPLELEEGRHAIGSHNYVDVREIDSHNGTATVAVEEQAEVGLKNTAF